MLQGAYNLANTTPIEDVAEVTFDALQLISSRLYTHHSLIAVQGCLRPLTKRQAYSRKSLVFHHAGCDRQQWRPD